MTRLRVAIAVALFTVLAAGRASAEPGDGVRVGEFVVTPSVQAQGGYHTNVRLLARPERRDNSDDWVLRIVPRVAVERVGGRANFTLFALYDWRKYAYNTDLDATDNFELGAATRVNEGRVLGLGVEDRFLIQSTPAELELLGQFRRMSNAARVTTYYQPGGAVEVRPAAFWDYDHFSTARRGRTFAERHTQGVEVDARWAFLAHTALAVTGKGGTVRYARSIDAPGLPGDQVNSDSTFWKVDGGVVGQVRPKLGMAVKVGYGQANYQRNESLDDSRGLSASLKMEWTPRVTNVLNAGYERGFSDVYFTNFQVNDRLFVNYRHLLAGEYLFQSAAVAEWQHYSSPFSRRDFVIRFEPSIRRAVRRWADVGASYRFERRWSSQTALPTAASVDPPSAYSTHRFTLTADVKF